MAHADPKADQQAFIPTKPSNRPPERKHDEPRTAWMLTAWDAALLGTGVGILALFWLLS